MFFAYFEIIGLVSTCFNVQDWININIKKGEFPFFFKFLPKILLAVCIGVMDDIYKKIAFWLNDQGMFRIYILQPI